MPEQTPTQAVQALSDADVDRIAAACAAATVAQLRGEGALPEIDQEIVGNDGPLYWTRASAKLLPGRRFLSRRSLQFCKTPEERALVLLNCGLNEDGSVDGQAKFGDGFAQADSVLTPKLQGAATPFVHPVVQNGFGFVLDRARPLAESDDGFPLIFAFRGLDEIEELEWTRLTAAYRDSITGGWKGATP